MKFSFRLGFISVFFAMAFALSASNRGPEVQDASPGLIASPQLAAIVTGIMVMDSPEIALCFTETKDPGFEPEQAYLHGLAEGTRDEDSLSFRASKSIAGWAERELGRATSFRGTSPITLYGILGFGTILLAAWRAK